MYVPARMMGKDFPATKRPDCFAVVDEPQGPVPSGHLYIEIEFNEKKEERERDHALLSGIRAVEEHRCDAVLYVSQSHSLLDNYRRYLTSERGLFRWKLDKASGKWNIQSEGHRQLVSDEVRLMDQSTAAEDAARSAGYAPLDEAIAATRDSEAGFPNTPSQYFIWWHVPWLMDGL